MYGDENAPAAGSDSARSPALDSGRIQGNHAAGANVNSYGKDLEQPISFAELLRKINAMEGEFVIRFMSSHPKDATPELLDTILSCEKVGQHLHLPVQCGSEPFCLP